MIIVGLTGGIASGKTTISNFLKKKRFSVHDSDAIVKKIYSNPTPGFFKYLKSINLLNSIKGKKINKNIIREEIFNKQDKKRKLEKFIHNEVRKSRNQFLNKHKRKHLKEINQDLQVLQLLGIKMGMLVLVMGNPKRLFQQEKNHSKMQRLA